MCLTVIQVAKRPRSVSLACGCMASRQAKSFIYKSQGDLFFFETEFEIWASYWPVGSTDKKNEKIYFLYNATFAIKSCLTER